jgi:subtilisin family serine protease
MLLRTSLQNARHCLLKLCAALSHVGVLFVAYIVCGVSQDERVELDMRVVPISSTGTATSNSSTTADNNKTRVVPWGLDRIDQVNLPLNGQYSSQWDGSGVTVFVMDTGVSLYHDEFQPNRASCGLDYYFVAHNGSSSNSVQQQCQDVRSHGTHVAAVVAGRTVGVARNATIVAVKIFDDATGFASRAAIAAGTDYILQQASQRRRRKEDAPMVVNMSFGLLGLGQFNKYVRALVRAGIVVVCAAGNDGTHVIRFTPGSAYRAITVGASSLVVNGTVDRLADFTNYGPLVDLFAYVGQTLYCWGYSVGYLTIALCISPGVAIYSASSNKNDEYSTWSGTSFSAPYVAGAAALYLQREPRSTPWQVRRALVRGATRGKLQRAKRTWSPNRLLYTGKL